MPAAQGRKAAGLHLALGVAIGALVLGPMLWLWYPRALLSLVGNARLALALAILAALLGPLAAVRSSRRRAIAIAQLIVLAGCALALALHRPVYLVFNVDRFDLVLAKDLDPRDLAKAGPAYARRPLEGPRTVAVLPPADPAAVQRILDQALDGGKDLQMYPEYYVSYEGRARAALARASRVDAILGRDGGALLRWLAARDREPGSVRFLPLRAGKRDGTVLLDAASGMPLGIVPVDPW